MELHKREYIEEAAGAVRQHASIVPQVALITGSGLAELADEAINATPIPYGDIPHFPQSTVAGHPGELVVGELENVPVVIQRGRVHFYEGYSMQQITFPIRVMQALGAETLIVTNAAGGLNPAFSAGDIMAIRDHLNLTGHNPLRGPNDPELGPRFPLMAGAYSPRLRQLARDVARELGVELQSGVYAGLAGPTFETPAELRFLQMMGADAVGMSTTPEVTVARHGGMQVLGFSIVGNMALPDEIEAAVEAQAGEGEAEEVHDEVLEAGQRAVPRLQAIIRGVLRNYAR
ncbi:MAG: Purine nucleoside phosphorylase 1 [Anaerolineales bacterium]|nr:Purine nucleoside phosphorylase 1 [Anaerolineales bacterium]